jgi:hypothetical protein
VKAHGQVEAEGGAEQRHGPGGPDLTERHGAGHDDRQGDGQENAPQRPPEHPQGRHQGGHRGNLREQHGHDPAGHDAPG